MPFHRYAVYFVPDDIWGDWGAQWLGWDNRAARACLQTDPSQIVLTERPRTYGFHATLKPPFRLASDVTFDALSDAVARLAQSLDPIPLNSLGLAQLGRFFALTAPEEAPALQGLAAQVVRDLDPFRAALTSEELARRRQSRLTPEQDALLLRWGYPYVMQEFRFHLTLTGPVKDPPDQVRTLLKERLAEVRDVPLVLSSLSVLGETEDGFFQEVARFDLAGR